MPNRSDAEEHLRIIRSLMEKATIYRAISAPGALVSGLLALGLAGGGLVVQSIRRRCRHFFHPSVANPPRGNGCGKYRAALE